MNSSNRIRFPQLQQNDTVRTLTTAEALEAFGKSIGSAADVIGIGSPRASLEANFALRELVGPEHFFAGVGDSQWRLANLVVELLRRSPAPSASLRQAERSDAVLVLGEDLTNTAPRMALSVRQSVRRQPFEQIAAKLKLPEWNDQAVRVAVQDAKGPLFVATPSSTRLDDVATETYRAAPEDIARLGFAIAHAIDPQAPAVADCPTRLAQFAERIAAVLKSASNPLVISGASLRNEAILQSAANVARALKRVDKAAAISLVLPDCNSFGLALLGPRPLGEAIEKVAQGSVKTAVILESDLYRHASRGRIDQFLSAIPHVVVIDCLMHQTSERAELILPAGTFAESDGTYISNEGRAQRFFKVFVPAPEIRPSWRWICGGMVASHHKKARAWENLDDVVAAISEACPELSRIRDAAPSAGFRAKGQKIPREPHRYSGRTAMLANITVEEPKPPQDADSALSFSMEGYSAQPPPSLTPFFWTPGWNSIQAVNKFQSEIAGPLRGGDPGIRLFEPATVERSEYFESIPPPFEPRQGEWVFLPAYHIFGSEELSRHAPGVAELSPKPYLGIGAADLSYLNVAQGNDAQIDVNGMTPTLPVRAIDGLPSGVALFPAGFGLLGGLELPARGTISLKK